MDHDNHGGEVSGGSPAAKIAGNILKYLIFGVIIFVYAIIMLRICTMGDPKSAGKYYWTAAKTEAYKARPDSFKVMDIDEKSEGYVYLTGDGKFAVSGIMLTLINGDEEHAQLQFTIRYNNSTIKSLMKEYDLLSAPLGEPFVFVLRGADKTYRSYLYAKDRKNLYNYRRVIFEDVDIKNGGGFIVDIYYIDDADLNGAPYGELPVYIKNSGAAEYDAAKDLPSGGGASEGLARNPEYLSK